MSSTQKVKNNIKPINRRLNLKRNQQELQSASSKIICR